MAFAELLESYRQTDYRVYLATSTLTLRIGEYASGLAELHQSFQVSSSAFVTAWNPGSEVRPREENAAANERLCAIVRERGYDILPGEGADRSGEWPPEPSILILGIDRTFTGELGALFGQNAVVFTGEQCIPELMMTLPQSPDTQTLSRH